jgi:hypothetical protein
MQAIQMALDAVAGHGDEVIHLSPAWPNFPAAVGIAGAVNVAVPLERTTQGGWWCDPAAIEACGDAAHARAVHQHAGQSDRLDRRSRDAAAILDIAGRHGLWIIADEIYALFHYGEGRALLPRRRRARRPDHLRQHLLQELGDDRLAHGLAEDPPVAAAGLREPGAVFHLRRAAVPAARRVAALEEGDAFLAGQVEQAGKCRDMLIERLRATGRVKAAPPQGAFYLFFEIDGVSDTAAAALGSSTRPMSAWRRAPPSVRRARASSAPASIAHRPDRGSGRPAGALDRCPMSPACADRSI